MGNSNGNELTPGIDEDRRKFLEYAGAGAKTFFTGVTADAGINTGILFESGELGNMGIKEDHLSLEAIRDIYYGNEVSVEVYVLEDDSIGEKYNSPVAKIWEYFLGDDSIGEKYNSPVDEIMGKWGLEEAGKILESKLDELGRGTFDVNFTSAEIDDSQELDIGDVTVKGFKHGVVDETRKNLKDEDFYNSEADLHAYIADFDAGLKDYKGSTVEEGEAAVANVYSPEYVMNQVIHNVGHLLGLGHASLFGSFFDSMTAYGAIRHARFRKTVVGYSIASRESFKDNAQEFLDIRRPGNQRVYPK